MSEFKVTVTKTEISTIIIKAEDADEAKEIINTAIKEEAIGFGNTPKYTTSIQELGK